ncbi:hypothetical protein ANN_17147 [Periplaneta americana]|uniref:THAP-type domain-containing protein n=1 Tax=Periplaneta americana TaxID=6978 RepID=A0ABQ8STF8_PERAM|nr:hypothetical protein ANN_17147 [Periplaneta americana]
MELSKNKERKTEAEEIRFLRNVAGYTLLDKNRNKDIRRELNICKSTKKKIYTNTEMPEGIWRNALITMPDKCCVPNCTSNYPSKGGYVPVFRFPNEEKLRQAWIRKIPRKHWQPSKWAVVCIHHFHEQDPAYLSTPETEKLRDPEERRARQTEAHAEKEKGFLEKDIIKDFSTFTDNVSGKSRLLKDFEDTDTLLTAKFSDLKQLYHCGNNVSPLLKPAHKLNHKSLYPSNLERQKVSLVCNIFHESTYSALNAEFQSQSDIVSSPGTCQLVLEAEKKLRMKSLLGIKSAKYGILKWSSQTSEAAENIDLERNETVDVAPFFRVIQDPDTFTFEADTSSLLYISGYASFKVSSRLQCPLCIDYLVGKETSNQDIYFDNLNRGGLTLPSDFVIYVAKIAFCIVNALISRGTNEEQFVKCGNQKKLLMLLCKTVLCGDAGFVNDVCPCGMEYIELADKILSVITNILLNNYSKARNDNISASKPVYGKRKLQTF